MNMKKLMAAFALGLTGLTAAVQAEAACCPDITVGVDWLYWSPCISGNHFALTRTSAGTAPNEYDVTETHYLCNDWSSGVRVYAALDNLWCGFNGALVYTYIDPSLHSSLPIANDVSPSVSLPGEFLPVEDSRTFEGSWSMEYQNLDGVLSYAIDVTRNRCLQLELFSGLTWVDVKQKARYAYVGLQPDNAGLSAPSSAIERENDFWAVGPCFGINSSFKFGDCFTLFSKIKADLVVGESKHRDVSVSVSVADSNNVTTINYEYFGKDKCSCFPGLHLMSGIEYELCMCDTIFALRLGWEYVQWINAPSFPVYEQGEEGVRSANASRDLTMQGIFVGLSSTF